MDRPLERVEVEQARELRARRELWEVLTQAAKALLELAKIETENALHRRMEKRHATGDPSRR